MLIPLHELVKKYNINFKGILHVGAHECEEIVHYDVYLPRNKVLWIEALPEKVEFCKKIYPDINIENAIISDIEETVTFKVSNNYQSSSILDFELHLVHHPQIHYITSFEGTTKVLKDILPKYNIDYNFLTFDIQGVELKALKGMEDYLNKVDYIYTEVNSDYVYKNCALVTEIDDYLSRFNLYRVETKWCQNFNWGDAFYLRK